MAFDWLARLGMVGPALPPLVPWQPAHAYDSIAAEGGAAWANADMVRTPVASAHPLHFIIIVSPPEFDEFTAEKTIAALLFLYVDVVFHARIGFVQPELIA